MIRPRLESVAALCLALSSAPAAAQVVVHDPAAYGSLLQQAQTALNQLNELRAQVAEAKRLYEGFNQISNVNDLAAVMASPQLRAFVPEIDAYVAAATGDFSDLGEIGQAAETIRKAHRLFTPAPSDPLGPDMEQAGDRAARDLALGREIAKVGAQRLEGLEELTSALDSAGNARAVMDIQARLAAEQAMIANDQMRLQGLAMAQDAEERLQSQRDRERSRAAAEARLKIFREAFQ